MTLDKMIKTWKKMGISKEQMLVNCKNAFGQDFTMTELEIALGEKKKGEKKTGLEIVKETAKAVMVKADDVRGEIVNIWLPKSQCEIKGAEAHPAAWLWGTKVKEYNLA